MVHHHIIKGFCGSVVKMKLTSLIIVIFCCLVSSSLGNPTDLTLLVREKRELDLIGSTQSLVKELIQNLQNAALDAIYAVKKFGDDLQDLAGQFYEKVLDDINKLRDQIDDSIKKIGERFSGAGSAVKLCISSFRKETDKIIADATASSKTCGNERIREIKDQIESLKLLSTNATDFANSALEELRNCNENSVGFLSKGSCLGGVAIKTDVKGAVFLTQIGLLTTRISFGFATLPPALEVCTGTRFVAAGISSSKVIMDIGTCAASSIYSSFTGNALTL